MGGRKHCLGPLRTFWELWKATAMGIKQDTEGRLPNLLYQNAGRVSGQTKSKVAECLGVPTLLDSQIWGNHRLRSLGADRKAPASWGEGNGGRRGLLTQPPLATCQGHPLTPHRPPPHARPASPPRPCPGQ